MRIRKRFPFSPSMASSVSDPQLNNSTLVQQTSSLLHPIQNNDSQPSDPPNPHLSSDQKPMIITNTLQPHKFQINQKDEASRGEQQEQNGSNNNNTSKEYNFLAVAPVGETGVSPPLGSYQVDGWFDGDEKVPLKKRKAQETMLTMLDQEKKMRPKMGSKTNKKSTSTSGMQQSHSEQDNKAGNDDGSSTPNNSGKKMNKRGGVIMEGSRCSRVNGRGWRCCQQTLVGYSLCEHHLGKGRLRSISNVKARTKAPNTVVATTIAPQSDTPESTTNDSTDNDNQSSKNVLVPSSVVQPPVRDHKDTVLLDGGCYDDDEEEEDDEDANEDEDDDDYNEEETKKPLVVKKKRMKLGMVKARSLSSLLNQTN